MARRNREVRDYWPSWRYGPHGESAIFERESEVPYGWTKRPGEIYVPPENQSLDRDSIIADLETLGADIHPARGTAYLKRMLDDLRPTR